MGVTVSVTATGRTPEAALYAARGEASRTIGRLMEPVEVLSMNRDESKGPWGYGLRQTIRTVTTWEVEVVFE